MARYDFGGTLADFVVTPRHLGGLDVLGLSAATLTFWSAQAGGTRYTDLQLNGSAVSSISVGTDGQVPTFQGPDTITAMWADGGAGRVRIVSQGIPGPAGPGATNADIAGYVATGATKTALDAAYTQLTSIATTATASATLTANRHTPVDATSGARTMTLPTAAAGALLSVEKTDASTNAVNVTGTLRGTASSMIALTSQYDARTYLSEGGGSWRPVSDHRTSASLNKSFASGQVDVTAYGIAAGGTNDAPIWNSLLATLATFGGSAFLPAGKVSNLTAPITPPSGARIYGGPGATIRQATASTPAFDALNVDDLTIQGLTLTSTATKVFLGVPAFRGSAGYVYSAGIWHSGNRGTFRDLHVSNFTCGIFLTSYNGVDENRYVLSNTIDNVLVDGVDFGLLAVGQDGAKVSGLRGSYSLTASSTNPSHLIYWSDNNGRTSFSRAITVSDCAAWNGSGGHAYVFKGVTSGRCVNLGARNCEGLVTLRDSQDMSLVGLNSIGDVEASGNGSIFVQEIGTEARLRLSNINIQMSTADARAVRMGGTDCSLSDAVIGVVHAGGAGAAGDITVNGTRCTIENVKVVNSSTAGGWYNVQLSTGTGHVARGISGVNARGGVQVVAGVTGCLVEVDGARFSPFTGYTGLRVVEDNNATAPLTVATWPMRRIAYSVTGGTITPLPANANLVDITITSSTALTLANPPTYQRGIGQQVMVSIFNSTAAAMGSTTFGTDYALASTFTSPAAGVRQTLTFVWNGTKWMETARA